MRFLLYLLVPVLLAFSACKEKKQEDPKPAERKSILLLTKTAGFRHESIPDGIKMIQKYADTAYITLRNAGETTMFTKDSLSAYDLIILLSTTGNLYSEPEQEALQTYVRAGGAVLGIHAACDAEYEWPWYGQMMGGWFEDHPAIQPATCEIKMQHPATKNLPVSWKHTDEWYNFKSLANDNNVLITVDGTGYTGSKHGSDHPISWYRGFEGGRIFYTAMGHTTESYTDPVFVQHIANAIDWLLYSN